ncbi:hypothetical protein [Bradyrhizobium murdochi]|uniref:hypothetical protein n=1 Tax=Bradyrhizobium murdochi TaxID=1038859 RepID=UPI00041E2527|nr:hypothetical protein [Bradyrhizobium murdochi]
MKKLKLPFLSERHIGFTIPKAETFYICDHDVVWRIAIGSDNPAVEVTDLQPYKFVEDRADFLGLVFDGLAENQPLLRVGPNEIVYDFDPNKNFVAVKYVTTGQSGEIQFPIFSGAWFAASLSDDGCYLVLAEPDEIALYKVA